MRNAEKRWYGLFRITDNEVTKQLWGSQKDIDIQIPREGFEWRPIEPGKEK